MKRTPWETSFFSFVYSSSCNVVVASNAMSISGEYQCLLSVTLLKITLAHAQPRPTKQQQRKQAKINDIKAATMTLGPKQDSRTCRETRYHGRLGRKELFDPSPLGKSLIPRELPYAACRRSG
jgi:hypothetical protein